MRAWISQPAWLSAFCVLAAALAACGTSSDNKANSAAAAGAAGASAGASGSSSSSGSGGALGGGKSDLPVPATSGVAKPSGALGGLTVLDWAGFKSAVSFTFDDSLSSQIAHYAELQAPGVHHTFYLISSSANAASPTWSQAALDGHEIGNHTDHHCMANGTSCGTYDGSPETELDTCTAFIEQNCGQSAVWTAASPYGDVAYDQPDMSRFLLNRGVVDGSIGAGMTDSTDAYNLPCHVAAMGETETSPNGGFDKTIDDAHTAGRWKVLLVHSLGDDGGYNPVSITDVVGAINHAQSLGDAWVDSVVHIGSYWVAQKLLQKAAPSGSDTQTWTWTLPAHFPPGRYLRVTVTGGSLSQGTTPLVWDDHGYYEVALDAGTLTLSP